MTDTGEFTLQVMKNASWYNNWLFSKLKPDIGKKVLEAGCGIGNFTRLLAKDSQVWAIDVNQRYIKRLNKEKIKNVKVGYGDIEKGIYFFKGEQFDSIVCLNVLEHIKDDKGAIVNMKLLLKDGGKLILLVPAHRLLYSRFDRYLGHFRRYDKKQLKTLIKKRGFEVESIKYMNWFAALGWFLFLKIGGRKTFPEREVGIFNILGRMFLWFESIFAPPFGLSIITVSKKKNKLL